VSSNRAQFMADRSALLEGSGADAHPRILADAAQGETGLLPLWQELSSLVPGAGLQQCVLAPGA